MEFQSRREAWISLGVFVVVLHGVGFFLIEPFSFLRNLVSSPGVFDIELIGVLTAINSLILLFGLFFFVSMKMYLGFSGLAIRVYRRFSNDKASRKNFRQSYLNDFNIEDFREKLDYKYLQDK